MGYDKNYIATIAYFLFDDAEKPDLPPSIHYGVHINLSPLQKQVYQVRVTNRLSLSELERKLDMSMQEIEKIGISAIDILFSKNDTFLNNEAKQPQHDTQKTMYNVR